MKSTFHRIVDSGKPGKLGILSARFLFVAALLFPLPRAEAELNAENKVQFEALLQAHAADFLEVKVLPPTAFGSDSATGKPSVFSAPLNRTPIVFEGDRYDGVRFRVPDQKNRKKGQAKKPSALDLVWAFAIERDSLHWYITPVEGEMEGFRNWFDADRAYQQFPIDDDPAVILQTLSAASLEAGGEYILWWNIPHENPVEVHGLVGFFYPPVDGEPWQADDIETVLQLTTAPAATQVQHLDSRGGRILLDEKFFDAAYAENRIENYLFTVRHTTRTQEGFVITMQVSVPPCRTNPPLSAIVEKYGDPDMITDQQVLENAGLTLFTDDPAEQIWWYDRFGFVIRSGDAEQRVQTVLSQAYDYSVIGPSPTGMSFADIPMRGLRQFTRDGSAVGWVRNFGEESAKVADTAPPPGEYLRHYEDGTIKERLRYEIDGAGQLELYYGDSALQRRLPFKNHRFQGAGVDFHPDGTTPRYKIPYKNGLIHGTVYSYAPDGAEIEQIEFIDGERTPTNDAE